MRVHVGVGSNLGDRWAHLALAFRLLRREPRVRVRRTSRVHDTDPVGPPQPRFLNAVIELETTLSPAELLAVLHRVEAAAGRRREVRWGPRTLDLDLLLAEDRSVRTPALTVPHPGLASRRFALAPLAELAPERLVPGAGASVAALLAAAPPARTTVVGLYPGW